MLVMSVKKALIISKTQQSTESLAKLLKTEGYEDVIGANSSANAKEFIQQKSFDLILINVPLAKETGLDLALYSAKETRACVVVIISEEHANAILDEMSKCGVLVISRPVNKHLFHHYLMFTDCFKKRILGIEQENDSLKHMVEEIKIVNRAKLLLMQCLSMSENQAHRYLEKQAMDMRMSKIQVAKQVIKTYEN